VLRAVAPEPQAFFDDAACQDVDVEVFFSQDESLQQEALELCSACPVRRECLEHALYQGEQYGIWGGTREGERRRISRERRRAA
jgi:WhiB family transcriptional regulator, redox-sensing transcriptional regulator